MANNIENELHDYETPNHLSCNTFRDLHSPRKRPKTKHTCHVKVPLMLVRKGQRQKTKPLKVLLDSGTSATIVNKKFCKKLKCKPAPKTLWKTKDGKSVRYSNCPNLMSERLLNGNVMSMRLKVNNHTI